MHDDSAIFPRDVMGIVWGYVFPNWKQYFTDKVLKQFVYARRFIFAPMCPYLALDPKPRLSTALRESPQCISCYGGLRLYLAEGVGALKHTPWCQSAYRDHLARLGITI